MADLIDNLRLFNRKERFFLLGKALGNPTFALSEEFRNDLGAKLKLTIPKDAYVAMDYHLDWVYASIILTCRESSLTMPQVDPHSVIKGHQEDVDTLIAFTDGHTYHLILIEAKGATGWKNNPMNSKAKRLADIFGEPDIRRRGLHIEPHFIACSPKQPQKLAVETWPQWMKDDSGRPRWIKLRWPAESYIVVRCNAAGKQDKDGGYYKIEVTSPLLRDHGRTRRPPPKGSGSVSAGGDSQLVLEFLAHVKGKVPNLDINPTDSSYTFTRGGGPQNRRVGLDRQRQIVRLHATREGRLLVLLIGSASEFDKGVAFIREHLGYKPEM